MKNKFLLIGFALLTMLFVFTLSVSAADVCAHNGKTITGVNYDDYAKNGKMTFTCPTCNVTEISIAPLFKLNGYAVSEEGDSMCTGYEINAEAVSALKALNSKFEAGIVIAAKELLGDKMPLNSATAEPVALSNPNARIIKFDASDRGLSSIDIKLTEITPESFTSQVYMCSYVFDGISVKYIQGESQTTQIKPVTYVEATGKTEYVDKNNNKYQYSIIKETKDADHRVGQMQYSASVYNKGADSGVSTWDLIKYEVAASSIVVGGSLAGYEQAKSYLSHYLNGSGKQFDIDMNAFLKDSVALSVRNKDINRALRAAEYLAIEGARVNMNQCVEQVNNVLTDDWYYALGGYFSRVNMTDLTCTEENGVKTYSTTLKYTVIDFYNWGTNGDKIFGIISQWQLSQLHKAGRAQEFLSYGEVSYTITWTEGQTVDQIAGLN